MLLGSFGLLLSSMWHMFSVSVNIKRQILAICVVICSAAALVMIFQGFHLWNQGWEGPMSQLDPSVAGRTAARSRRKGGVVLLALQFFPQFLVFGYGGMIWSVKDEIKDSLKDLGFLKRTND